MGEKITERLSDAELDIMRTLWSAGLPLKASEIVRLLSGKYSWKTPTAHVILNRLCDKGYVNADRSGYSHKFYPVITEEAYFASQSTRLVRRTGRSIRDMVASLIDTDEITDDDIIALSDMLDKKRTEIENRKQGGENG